MQLDVVNHENQKVGSVDINDAVFGGRINGDLMWESVVHANAADRSGTHAAKTRAFVSGTGKKPWKQKGTGRAQVGSSRTPLWRHGGTVHPPRPRSYDFKLSKKVEIGALRSALAEKIKAGDVIVVDALSASAIKTKAAVEMLKRLGITGKAVLVDVAADEKLSRSVRNIPGVSLVPSIRLTARDVIDARSVVATRGALEKLQEALA
jgi:large subunit ribosomal protein L4